MFLWRGKCISQMFFSFADISWPGVVAFINSTINTSLRSNTKHQKTTGKFSFWPDKNRDLQDWFLLNQLSTMFHSKKVNILLGIWSFELNWKMAGTSHFVAHPHPECCCGFVFKNSELLLNKNGKIIGMPCFKCCSAKQEIYQHPSISWLQKIFLVIKRIPNNFFLLKSFT